MLPAIPGQLLFFVGVGTAQAANEFATQLGIDPSLCFGDDGGAAGDVLGLTKGFDTMWNPPVVETMMARNDNASLAALGEAYKTAAGNIGIRNLTPERIEDTLRQGGTFVFRGNKLVLGHFDSKVGDNCEIEDILAVLK